MTDTFPKVAAMKRKQHVYLFNVEPDAIEGYLKEGYKTEFHDPKWDLDMDIWFAGIELPTLNKILDHIKGINEVELTPIVLLPNGQVLDGYHRILACILRGMPIQAHRLKTEPEPVKKLRFTDVAKRNFTLATTLKRNEKIFQDKLDELNS
jgi:hypothetical protein